MNIKKVNIDKIYILVFFLMLCSCNNQLEYKENSLIKFVDPFIGTGGHGHTYPGASMPFGMMQLSPDTRLDGWTVVLDIIILMMKFMVFLTHILAELVYLIMVIFY